MISFLKVLGAIARVCSFGGSLGISEHQSTNKCACGNEVKSKGTVGTGGRQVILSQRLGIPPSLPTINKVKRETTCSRFLGLICDISVGRSGRTESDPKSGRDARSYGQPAEVL